jgi:beta-lactam-binding protein with PASTA domain
LQDQSLRAAQIELLRAGMQLGEVTTVLLPGTDGNTVLQQDPSPGTSQVSSPHVNLLVSASLPATAYAMPELVGLPLAEAESKLAAAGLRTPQIALLPDANLGRGTILAQTPARGQRVDGATAITLQMAE